MTQSGRRVFSISKNSSSRANSSAWSVLVTTLTISGDHSSARRATLCKARKDGVRLTSWQERMRFTPWRAAASNTPRNKEAERISTSTKVAIGKYRSKSSRRLLAGNLFCPPSSGWRAVMMRGCFSRAILRSVSPLRGWRESSRSSKKSGGRRKRRAHARSEGDAITPTREVRCFHSLTEVGAAISYWFATCSVKANPNRHHARAQTRIKHTAATNF